MPPLPACNDYNADTHRLCCATLLGVTGPRLRFHCHESYDAEDDRKRLPMKNGLYERILIHVKNTFGFWTDAGVLEDEM